MGSEDGPRAMAKNPSLAMEADRDEAGRWTVVDPALDEAVEADTFEEAYWECIRRRGIRDDR